MKLPRKTALNAFQSLIAYVSQLFFTALIFCSWCSESYAQVYKCVVNGKTTYSDSRCAYEADTVNITPNKNLVSGGQSIKSDSKSDGADPKCAELLEEITYQSGHINKSSHSAFFHSLNKVKALKYKYKVLCQ